MSEPSIERAALWVVEMLTDDDGWRPTIEARLTQHDARRELDRWKACNPDDTFRIAEYSRAK